MEGMLPGDWKRLETTIRVAVTRAIIQGVICIILLVVLIGAAWAVWTRLAAVVAQEHGATFE